MSRRLVNLVNACLPVKALVFCLLALGATATPARAQSGADPVYVFHTNLGDISVQLFPEVAPHTVANFLHYVSAGAYNNSLVHRSVPGFIFQGGGYTVQSGSGIATVPAFPSVVNEFHLSNTRGTIAMAKLGGDPNSATSQWFFNEADSNAANLDKQNGGFTVFGKVLDAASLAVMDRIAAAPVPNPSPFQGSFGEALDQIPLINYQSGMAVQASNLVVVSSITPATVHTHLLWTNPDGRAVLWDSKADGTFGDHGQYGPYTDAGGTWKAVALATGPDGVSHILWTSPDGRAVLWYVNPDGSHGDGGQFGPYTDAGGTWRALTVSVGPDSLPHLLWTNADGRAVLWDGHADGSYTNHGQHGPYTDAGGTWKATAVSVGPDDLPHLLWTNPDGRAVLWNGHPDGTYSDRGQYGPYIDAGGTWRAATVSVGPDDLPHLLWTNPSGRSVLWDGHTDGTYSDKGQHGPYTDAGGIWAALTVSVGPDALPHLLWTNPDGRAVLWNGNGDGTYSDHGQYGPYTDAGGTWRAVAASTGP